MTECTSMEPIGADEGIRQIRQKVCEWINDESADPLDALAGISAVVFSVYLVPTEPN